MRVAAIQMEITKDKTVNLEKAKKLLVEAGRKGCQLACLPEYFLCDCPEQAQSRSEVEKLAETIPGPATDTLTQVARQTGMYICSGSFVTKSSSGELSNTSCLISPSGDIVGQYSKSHPENAPPKYEVGHGLVPGSDYPVFDTTLGKIGIMIDMDATTAEVPRILYIRGAEIVLWPLNWSTRWFRAIEALPPAHSMMNKVFIVAANRVGLRQSPHGTFLYNGGSSITNPEGFTVARANDFYEGLAVCDLDMELVRLWRTTIIPRDYPLRRRPETYGAIVEPWKV